MAIGKIRRENIQQRIDGIKSKVIWIWQIDKYYIQYKLNLTKNIIVYNVGGGRGSEKVIRIANHKENLLLKLVQQLKI